MDYKKIFSLAVKILGIYSAIMAIASLSYISSFFASIPIESRPSVQITIIVLIGLVPVFLLFFTAFFMVKYSDAIAEKVCGKDQRKIEFKDITERALYHIFFSGIGILIFATTLPDIANLFYTLYYNCTTNDFCAFDVYLIKSLVVFILKMGIAILLIFGSRGFINFLQGLKSKN